MDFRSCTPLRYATMNFTSHQAALEAAERLQGQAVADGALAVSWNEPLQGLREHIRRYRNSPVMHESVPQACKPLLFRGGLRQAFPAPTRVLKRPRLSQP